MTEPAPPSPPAPPAPPATPAPPAAPWHQGVAGFDEGIIGHAQNKGWLPTDVKELPAAFAKAVRSHSEMEKFRGIPADKILRIPEASASKDELDAFWQRIGAPKEAKDIDWAGVKTASGDPIDPKLAERLTATAIASRAPKDVVLAIARDVVKHMDDQRASAETIRMGWMQEQQQEINQSWGTDPGRREANWFVAKQGFLKTMASLGADPAKTQQEANEKFRDNGGLGALQAKVWHKIGLSSGEGKYVSLGGGSSNEPMTVEAAKDELAMLMKDQAWVKKLHTGGKEENQRWQALNRRIASGMAA